jgi:hypothetical protein
VKTQRLALRLAASALAISIVAVSMAAYSLSLSQDYMEDVRTLGLALQRRNADNPAPVLEGPPPALETE